MKRKRWIGILGILLSVSLIYTPISILASTTNDKTEGSNYEYIDEYAKEYIGDSLAGAAVVIAKDGEIVFKKGYGYANKKDGIEVNPDTTIFEYGSITKLFTWTSAMQLYEEGKLDLNENIKTYLPEEVSLKLEYKTPITMLNLMNHTAGFGEYIAGVFSKKDNIVDIYEGLNEIVPKQYYEPGSVCSYSNYGAGLAGAIVQNVSGQDFSEYVDQHILKPANIKNMTMRTDFEDVELLSNKSLAYTKENGRLVEADWTYIPVYPMGGANGTATELTQFASALMQENTPIFKSDVTRDEMFEESYATQDGAPGVSHGFFELDRNTEHRVLWHNGGTENFSSFLGFVPEEKFSIVILTNTSEGGEEFINKVINDVFPAKMENTPQIESLPSTQDVVGSYNEARTIKSGITQVFYRFSNPVYEVKASGDNEIKINGDTYTQIRPYVYEDKESGKIISFGLNESGKVNRLNHLQDFMKVTKREATVQKLLVFGIIFAVITGLGSIIIVHNKLMFITLGVYIVLFINSIFIAGNLFAYENFSYVRANIYMNILFGILALIFGVINAIVSKKKRSFVYIGTAADIILLVILLVCGFFNPMG